MENDKKFYTDDEIIKVILYINHSQDDVFSPPRKKKNNLGFDSYYTQYESNEIRSFTKEYKTEPREDIKTVFNDMLQAYYKKHKNSEKKPTYKAIADTVGLISNRKLSDIVNSNQLAEREDLLLICYVLDADIKNINRFLIAGGQHIELMSLSEAKENKSLSDIVVNAMYKFKTQDCTLSMIQQRGTARDAYHEILRTIVI